LAAAIVCASSRGLGRACAERLAEAGWEVVINGIDPKRLDATAADIRSRTARQDRAPNVSTKQGQDALFAACPEPDILIGNNVGPPFRDSSVSSIVRR
jgi:3-oxoacyl-[acyl-carrier protein] reductase